MIIWRPLSKPSWRQTTFNSSWPKPVSQIGWNWFLTNIWRAPVDPAPLNSLREPYWGSSLLPSERNRYRTHYYYNSCCLYSHLKSTNSEHWGIVAIAGHSKTEFSTPVQDSWTPLSTDTLEKMVQIN